MITAKNTVISHITTRKTLSILTVSHEQFYFLSLELIRTRKRKKKPHSYLAATTTPNQSQTKHAKPTTRTQSVPMQI